MLNYGVSSSVAQLRRVAVRAPASDGDYQSAGWIDAARGIDTATLRAEHAAFVALLERLGCIVEHLSPAAGLADAIFVYDPVWMTPAGSIQLQCAKRVRRPENALLTRELIELGVPQVGALFGDAVADGGDLFWLDERTIALGRSYRTNALGEEQLTRLLAPMGIKVRTFHMPHAAGPEACLHLMSVVSPIRDDLAVVYEREAPVTLLEELHARRIQTIKVPDSEYATLATNVLAVSPGVVVMPDGNPMTAELLVKAGVDVHAYSATLINRGEGGPTCLTRPLWRRA